MTDIDLNSFREFDRSATDLYESCPLLLRERPVITVMIGWHGLIADCFADLQEVLKVAKLPADKELAPRIVDIKEKYGSLRILLSGFVLDDEKNEQIMDIISHYEDLSMRVCETCGKPGKLTRKGWIKTSCEMHK